MFFSLSKQALRKSVQNNLRIRIYPAYLSAWTRSRSDIPNEVVSCGVNGDSIPHQGSIYIHHTTVGAGVNSAAVTLGLIHSLEVLCPGLGYFRPVDSTSHGGHRSKLVQEVFKLSGKIEEMQGCSQAEAYKYISENRMDDLIELILKSYEQYKARHDFVVVEGTSLKDGSISTPFNAAIASAIDSPVMFVTDASVATKTTINTIPESAEFDSWDWETEVINSLIGSKRVLAESNVDIVGSLVYKLPRRSRRGATVLKTRLNELGIPLAGAVPDDELLQSLQVQDLFRVLDAQLLYGGQAEGSLSTEVTKKIVATLQLSDLLAYLPSHSDPTKGSVVIAHTSRPDVLLGMMNLHESNSPVNIASVILTGGEHVPVEIDALIRYRSSKSTLPVLMTSSPTYETCVKIAQAEPILLPNSTRKIERAQVLFDDNVDMQLLQQILFKERPVRMNPKLFQHNLFKRAKSANQHIVLPEGEEPRTIQAAGEVLRRGLAKVTLLGSEEKILTLAKQFRVDLSSVSVVDPAASEKLPIYTEYLYNARKHKGMTLDQAREQLIGDVNFFGTAMVALGDADGMVSGAIHTTANTVRPALQLIKTLPTSPIVSSVFFMCLPDKILAYGDCAINTNPSVEELATIAISSADTAAAFGIEPRVAMLSYATGDSNTGPLIQKVSDATALVHKLRPDLPVEGPIQYDAAVNPETALTKLKGKESKVAGKATVLIFPDLNTGNNTYKAVQQSTGAVAMGPVLQGLRKPVNDLSRGCTIKDIVTTIAITAVQALAMKNRVEKQTNASQEQTA